MARSSLAKRDFIHFMVAAPRAGRERESAIPAHGGIGLRFPHHAAFLETEPNVGWVEVHTENYLSGPAADILERVRSHYPVSLHGVGLSLGSPQGIDRRHLKQVTELATRIEPVFVSEHLSWSIVDGEFLPDLLPFPLTQESLSVVSRNVDAAQQAFQRQILIENPATYLQFSDSTVPEPEFLSAVVASTGCGLICDVNNIFVSATNHGWDPRTYLKNLPADSVYEFHLAGHGELRNEKELLLVDSHDRSIAPAVWSLFRAAVELIGCRPTLIERDARIPRLPVLLDELLIAEKLLANHEERLGNAAVA